MATKRNIISSLIILLISSSVLSNAEPVLYSPEDSIAVDCGSSGTKTIVHERSWSGDVNSKFFDPAVGENKASIVGSVQDTVMQPDSVPFGTARLSRAAFTYSIPVTPGPKFVRLFFYAAAYDGFNSSSAFFSVRAGDYTLLSNFSALLAADHVGAKHIDKEFCVTVEDPWFNVTFTPSSSVPNGWAFVNGIEVMSMPVNLYYTSSESRGLQFVAMEKRYFLSKYIAMENVYRINIGGSFISAADDTGMFRKWDSEDDYLTVPGVSVLPVELKRPLVFTGNGAISKYTAPAPVYQSARSTGNDVEEIVSSYRLTWEFPVDSGFYYFLRLHFCEIQQEMNSTGQRVFEIFIVDEMAESRADVFMWSGGQYTPYVRDYVVPMFNRGENFSVAIRAIPDHSISSYTDAILNGIEIFKLNNTAGSLAGPNPAPILRGNPVLTRLGGKEKNSRAAVIGIAAGVVSGVILLALVGFFAIRRRRKYKDSASDGTTWWGPYSSATTKSTKTRTSTTLPSNLCRYFTLAEIKAATNGFDDVLVIGVGGFGNVYKGYIDMGATPVAVKRLKSESSQGAHEFKTEIEMLSHLRHRHLVSLIGFCDEPGEMILVYEYMSRGTLRDHLYKTENPPLLWKARLEICIGTARGLHYLHTGAKNTIIHRDVKTTNILLDEKWEAKVSDFGLSKASSTSVSNAHVTTVVKGSFGYLDPEYYNLQHLTEKSDVYSFGVVLCEVLCARPPVLRDAERRQIILANWAKSSHKSGTLNRIVDTNLAGQIAPECLKKYGEIAVSCMLDIGIERPSMSDIVGSLEFALQLQKSAEDNDRVGGPLLGSGGPNEDEDFVNNDSDGTFTCSWNDTPRSTGVTKISSSEQEPTMNESVKVFSELYDPKGR